MDNQAMPSKNTSNGNWFTSIIQLVLGYYSELIAQPFKSGLFYFLAGLMPSLIIGWIVFPIALYSKQPQPFNFSHNVHMDADRVDDIEGDTEVERCLFCHGFRDDGTFIGIPKLDTCMECHDDPEMPMGEDPNEEKFLKEYVADEKEVPWLPYYRQPDCVYFSHIAHVKMGNLDCKTCHGDHGNTDQMPSYKKNRLTGYSINIWGRNILGYKTHTWERMKMDDCAECHSNLGHEENNACFVCHK